MIQLNNLTWLYQRLPMRFTLHARAGERLAILGPSGAGKSTLLNLIAGFLHATCGTLTLNGRDHRHTPPARRPVSMLFQENNLFTHLSVRQNIGLGLHPGLRLSRDQRQQLQQLAQQMGIGNLLDRLPGALSGGQRQRVALARCLIRQQPILLLDEPFSALDPALRQEMLSLLDDICTQRHLTLLMVSHNIEDAARIAPRVLVIADGHVIDDTSTSTLLSGQSPAGGLLGITPGHGTRTD